MNSLLGGLAVALVGSQPASEYALWLLRCLGATAASLDGPSLAAVIATTDAVRRNGPVVVNAGQDADPIFDWASSGAMALTGRPDGPPLVAPGNPATAARGALLAFEVLSALNQRRVSLEGHLLLGERAACAGLLRRAPVSPGGSFRIIEAADGWIGVSISRPTDLARLPALVEEPVDEPWNAITAWARRTSMAAATSRADMLGMAISPVREPADSAADEQAVARGQSFPLHPFVIDGLVARPTSAVQHARSFRQTAPLVVDLSSLWAGPLCAHLLALAGCRVVKVESTSRPDGTRRGNKRFFDLLHAGHESVSLELTQPEGRRTLASLVSAADIVIESSRPRALVQLGLDAKRIVETDGQTWVSITAYGRSGPWANRIGFGDDAAAAAGLATSDHDGKPFPCGDAIGDPLAGMHAAVVALASAMSGGGRVVDVSIRDVVGGTLADAPIRTPLATAVRDSDGDWFVDTAVGPALVEPPSAREPAGEAPSAGAHTPAVLTEFGLT